MAECAKCKHEHDAKFCPECGHASGTETPAASPLEKFKAAINEVLDERATKRKAERRSGGGDGLDGLFE